MAVSSSGRATLLLLLLQALSRQPVTAYTPTSNAQLKQAAFDWCQDPVAAEATYGAHIKDWDTSQITSMTELFMTPPAGCTVFNDDISGYLEFQKKQREREKLRQWSMAARAGGIVSAMAPPVRRPPPRILPGQNLTSSDADRE